tara:strand:- start:728 stop:1132 length:405 start_codon:yes stop_codon:yes gene_type:complete
MKKYVLYNSDLLYYIYDFLECKNIFQEVCKEWSKISKKCKFFTSNFFKFPKYCIYCYPEINNVFKDISFQYLKHISKKNMKNIFYVHSRIDLNILDYEKIVNETNNLEIIRKCCRETHGVYKYIPPGIGIRFLK